MAAPFILCDCLDGGTKAVIIIMVIMVIIIIPNCSICRIPRFWIISRQPHAFSDRHKVERTPVVVKPDGEYYLDRLVVGRGIEAALELEGEIQNCRLSAALAMRLALGQSQDLLERLDWQP